MGQWTGDLKATLLLSASCGLDQKSSISGSFQWGDYPEVKIDFKKQILPGAKKPIQYQWHGNRGLWQLGENSEKNCWKVQHVHGVEVLRTLLFITRTKPGMHESALRAR